MLTKLIVSKNICLLNGSFFVGNHSTIFNSQFYRHYSQNDNKGNGKKLILPKIYDGENLNPFVKQKIKHLLMEMEIEKHSGNFYVPAFVEDKQWLELIQKKTPWERKKYYRYLKMRELEKEKQRRKHARKVLEYHTKSQEMRAKNPHHCYGPGKNTMFYVPSTAIARLFHNNLLHAMSFGQDIVVDCGYEHSMKNEHISRTVSQIGMLYQQVKYDKDPFNMHFCNVDPDGDLKRRLKLHLPFLNHPFPLLTVSEKSYLDFFPRERIVYLTADCRNDLHYNHNDVYVIGGRVGQGRNGQSFIKAKKEKLRMARLPLDKHLDWNIGTKSLPLNIVMKILITMKNTMNWTKAFEHVPQRKLKRARDVQPKIFPFINSHETDE